MWHLFATICSCQFGAKVSRRLPTTGGGFIGQFVIIISIFEPIFYFNVSVSIGAYILINVMLVGHISKNLTQLHYYQDNLFYRGVITTNTYVYYIHRDTPSVEWFQSNTGNLIPKAKMYHRTVNHNILLLFVNIKIITFILSEFL